ncbi:phosphatidylinositol phosphatase PTPRQ isoform X1 [Nasonia vitripennis]|uniref:protein-tyrosine-phosphatase n=1 Tax=Nasonia vitripennis TaxID=7425 RepID=A0A7M7LU71_NASVI|nr:phosphatidylinositol phosphatase PTPRQ isoform X1 [Nasonia vitripennis]XP_008205235.1 phosphatidylinositol phosphatase PTPRQ isoform X1 [Nasonia vitripennis]
MIPRKRLQVLLYILQIFYVFGDGDPGSDGLLLKDLPNNVIDEPAFTSTTTTTTPPPPPPELIDHHKSLNSSQKIYNSSDYGQKEEDSLDTRENVVVTDKPDLSNSNRITYVEGLEVARGPTFLNVSWISSGADEYEIKVWTEEEFLDTYWSKKSEYSITGLEPCREYRIGVTPMPTHENDAEFINTTTEFEEPGPVGNVNLTLQEPFSLVVRWDMPENANRCIQEYKIIADTVDIYNRHTVTNYTTETKFVFENLRSCFKYWVSVSVIDITNKTASTTNPIESVLPIYPKVASAPWLNISDVRTINTTKESITLIWDVKNNEDNCTLKEVISTCHYNYTSGGGISIIANGTSKIEITDRLIENVTTTIKNLSPYSHYVCTAYSINEKGDSPLSEPVYVLTSEDRPSTPQNFQSLGRENSKLWFIWDPPRYRPGKLLGYRINFTWVPCSPVPDGCTLKREFVVDNIDPTLTKYSLMKEEAYSQYTARIEAKTGGGWSPSVEIKFYSITQGVPDKVTNLTITIKRRDDDPNALDTQLSWGLPCSLQGILHRFNVSVYGTRSGLENHTITTEVNVTDDFDKNEIFVLDLGELKPLYTYKFEVFAEVYSSTDSGEIADLEYKYPAGIPPQPEMEYIKSITLDPHKARRTTTSAAILLPLFPDANGDIKYYAIMVSGVPFDNSSSSGRFDIQAERWPNVSSWEEAMEKDFQIPYQATEPLWNPFPSFVVDYGHMKAVKFVVGEDTTCPDVSSNTKTRAYCNGPLKSDTWYEVRMRAFTDQGYADSVSFTIKTNAELNVGLVLGVVFGILFIGILTTLMLLVKRCSFRLLLQRILQSNIPESPVPDPFTRRKFINHCQQLAENPGKLSNEFQLLQTLSVDLQMPSNAACLQANRKKNRYSDILPYDFSRVKLEVIDNDPNTDYINASFIRGYSGNEEYIACQGPKEDTTYDFWRMIDQYDVKMILMLTQLVEKGKEKCHQYYPTIRETFNYEKLSIRCTSELDYRNFTQRTLVLQKDDKRRTITHLHFKDWPDHDVPDDFDAMIHFCQIFRKQFSTVKGLAVIHCSAGIGRTGTLIAIDILLQSIRDNRKLDVFGTVYRLRRHRLNMVQRESQYAYIYNCIRQVLKNPYFLKTYKPPPIDPIYSKDKTKKDRSDSNTDLVDSFDTLKKNSLSTSIDSMQPLCQSSPQTTPKIQMNVLFAGLRYCKSTSAIDTRTNHNRIGRYNSEGYAICESARDSFSTTSKESTDENNDLKSSSSSLYENVEPLIRPSSSQTIAGSSYYLTNDSGEKDTSL